MIRNIYIYIYIFFFCSFPHESSPPTKTNGCTLQEAELRKRREKQQAELRQAQLEQRQALTEAGSKIQR